MPDIASGVPKRSMFIAKFPGTSELPIKLADSPIKPPKIPMFGLLTLAVMVPGTLRLILIGPDIS
jgi:hypothetical protein